MQDMQNIKNIKSVDEWKKILKKNMSEKRFMHSCNVAKCAKELAEKYGEDPDRAYLAGLLHDMCKELPDETQLEYVKNSRFYIDPAELEARKVWHGPAAAYLLEKKYNIHDDDFLRSIRFHTVARADMSLIEEIIYVADMISAERSYPAVYGIRAIAKDNLKLAVLAELQYSIPETISKGGKLPVSTTEAYNFYIKYMREAANNAK